MPLKKRQKNNWSIKNNLKNAGFTLVEMMIVIAIFSILTSVIVFNYSKFNSDILLTNMAYEVALGIREAQVYSLGVRSAGNNFNTRYGVYFDIDDTSGGNSENFVFFTDVDNDGLCQSDISTGEACSIDVCSTGQNNECQNVNTLTRDSLFERICVASDGSVPMNFDTGECNAGTGFAEKDSIAVTFSRPNPDTKIKSDDGTEYNTAAILMRSNQEDFKKIIHILSNGQMTIKTWTP